MQTHNIDKHHSIEVKRFYLPVEAGVKCPHCGKMNVKDFEDDYLSYPEVGENIQVSMYCEHCEEQYTFNVKLTMQLEVDDINTAKL